jgi:predicted HTH domain antitoxin
MTLELPDSAAVQAIPPADLRLELACALFARGRVSAITGAHIAGVDLFTFQHALADRRISRVSEESLAQDLATLAALPPR